MNRKTKKELDDYILERALTRRQELALMLSEQELTVREIGDYFRATTEEIVEDLKHIAYKYKDRFVAKPAICKMCGFIFKEREKIRRKPSKCPRCRNEKIQEPRFSLKE